VEVYADIMFDISNKECDDGSHISGSSNVEFCSVSWHKGSYFDTYHSENLLIAHKKKATIHK